MIDKRINYAWGGPGGKSPGRGGPAGGATGGGGGGRDRGGPPSISSRPAPAPRPVTTAVAPPSILSKVDPVDIEQGFVPGDVKPVKKHIPPVRHHEDTEETKEEQRQLDIQQMIAKQQEEKYGPMADPTKFGEIVEGPDKRTQKEKDEDVERATDWDKVKDLSKKGYDFKEIQDAMEKGLLTKADPQSMKQIYLEEVYVVLEI